MKNFQNKFIEDATELLNKLEGELLQFEKKQDDNKLIESIMRAMHTLKGSGGMFGFDKIVIIAHKFETIFKKIQEGKIQASDKIISLCFNSIDIISKNLIDHKLKEKNNKELYKLILKELSEYTEDDKEHKTKNNQKGLFYIAIEPDADIEKRAVKIKNIFNELFSMGQLKTIPRNNTEKEIQEGNKYSLRWELFLATDCNIEDIEEILIFLEFESKILFLSDKNLLSDEYFKSLIENFAEVNSRFEQEDLEKIVNKAIRNTETITKEKFNHIKELSKIQKQETSSLRVDAEKLDELMRYVSELISVKSEIKLSAQMNGYKKITEIAEKLDNITTNIRENVFDIRLVALETIKVSFDRLVRDTAARLKKNVKFIAKGLNTELDKTIVDSISAPLLHIIRNSIDHGIESPEERFKLGKPKQGLIKLEAYLQNSNVYIKISDDGAGIDKQKIVDKAIAKNIISSEKKLTEKEIFSLIFAQGLSTAVVISEVSGRGVGMDVVKSEINKLRGEITIKSKKGEGTTVIFKLPVSVSIIDTMLVKTNNIFFSIPLDEIEGCIIIKPDKVKISENQFIEYNSKLIPYITLNEAFNIEDNYKMNKSAIIIKNKKKYTAVITDKVIDEFQAVVKPLGETFKGRDYLTGGIILPAGKIAYVLNTSKLIDFYSKPELNN